MKRIASRRAAGVACLLLLLLFSTATALAGEPERVSESTAKAGELWQVSESAAEAGKPERVSESAAEAGGEAGGIQADGGQSNKNQTDESRESDAGKDADAGASGTAVGAAVLVGAGTYTYVRKKLKENKSEQKYEYFENHTQNGTLLPEEKKSI